MDLDKENFSKSSPLILKFEGITKYINFGLIVLIIGLISYYIYQNTAFANNSSSSKANAETISKDNSPVSNSTNMVGESLNIDISGAVKAPGVYQMRKDERIVDLIKKAGGFDDKVDLNYVEKNINQAQKLSDGLKIYIPRVNESSLAIVDSNVPNSNNINLGKVSINSANKQDLVNLPEIGEVTADKIIKSRPYLKLEDLVEKKILKQSAFENIKDLITL